MKGYSASKDPGRKIGIMAVVNLTPDSYYAPSRVLGDDGLPDESKLAARLEAVLDEGADIVDLGASSTRPGAVMLTAGAEWTRLLPALRLIRREFPGLPVSIDTVWSEVISRACDLIGPVMVNDISSGEDDPCMLPLVAGLGLDYAAMHKRGNPSTMQGLTDYSAWQSAGRGDSGVVAAVQAYFRDFSRRAAQAGLDDWFLDPGFGFAKTAGQNLELLDKLDSFLEEGHPILVGISRKSFIYKPLGLGPEDVLQQTTDLHLKTLGRGASMLRVHDVRAAVETVALYRRNFESKQA